jgi:single-strand DNA-binding protein
LAGSLNKVTLIGNVGQDPEIRSLNSGDRCANLSIATSESWTDKSSGEKKEKTEWHRVVVFGKVVDVVERYVTKGSKIYIEGALQTRKWQDQSGADRYSTEVVLKPFGGQLILLGDRKSGDGGERSSGGGQTQQHTQTQARGNFTPDLDDDIPF